MKTRCKTGCLTCRKRRKKCDESSYPLCKNCQTNSLRCTWPQSVIESKREKFSSLTQIEAKSHPSLEVPEKESIPSPASEVSTPLNPNFGALRHEIDIKTPSEPASGTRPLSNSRSGSYFLQKIAMQEDCVDDDAPLQHTPKPDVKSSIRSRIWNQLDVIDDLEFIGSKSHIDITSERGSPSPVNT